MINGTASERRKEEKSLFIEKSSTRRARRKREEKSMKMLFYVEKKRKAIPENKKNEFSSHSRTTFEPMSENERQLKGERRKTLILWLLQRFVTAGSPTTTS